MSRAAIAQRGAEPVDAIAGLPTYRGIVYPWHCDHMGHMNVMWYTGKFDEASWSILAQLGLSAAAMRARERRMAAVEQAITYRRELFAGDAVTITSAVREVRTKSLTFVHAMRRDGDGEPAAICVVTGVHIDAGTRLACALPEDIAARARALIAP